MAFGNINQPETFEERCDLAQRMIDEYEMPMDVLVDTMSDSSRALFTDLPSPVYVLDAQGKVQAKYPWPDQEQIKNAVDQIVSTGQVAEMQKLIKTIAAEKAKREAKQKVKTLKNK
ncbi:MAG: hypothetical protein AAFN77_13585 [Planctomycetota bacterium]